MFSSNIEGQKKFKACIAIILKHNYNAHLELLNRTLSAIVVDTNIFFIVVYLKLVNKSV